MQNARTCYFSVVHTGELAPRVRFGFSRRPDSQIEVSDESWKHIAARLRYESFELVEFAVDPQDESLG